MLACGGIGFKIFGAFLNFSFWPISFSVLLCEFDSYSFGCLAAELVEEE